jgi:hypothetical protein
MLRHVQAKSVDGSTINRITATGVHEVCIVCNSHDAVSGGSAAVVVVAAILSVYTDT